MNRILAVSFLLGVLPPATCVSAQAGEIAAPAGPALEFPSPVSSVHFSPDAAPGQPFPVVHGSNEFSVFAPGGRTPSATAQIPQQLNGFEELRLQGSFGTFTVGEETTAFLAAEATAPGGEADVVYLAVTPGDEAPEIVDLGERIRPLLGPGNRFRFRSGPHRTGPDSFLLLGEAESGTDAIPGPEPEAYDFVIDYNDWLNDYTIDAAQGLSDVFLLYLLGEGLTEETTERFRRQRRAEQLAPQSQRASLQGAQFPLTLVSGIAAAQTNAPQEGIVLPGVVLPGFLTRIDRSTTGALTMELDTVEILPYAMVDSRITLSQAFGNSPFVNILGLQDVQALEDGTYVAMAEYQGAARGFTVGRFSGPFPADSTVPAGKGDVNGDGIVSIIDQSVLGDVLAGQEPDAHWQLDRLDFDDDGDIDGADERALWIAIGHAQGDFLPGNLPGFSFRNPGLGMLRSLSFPGQNGATLRAFNPISLGSDGRRRVVFTTYASTPDFSEETVAVWYWKVDQEPVLIGTTAGAFVRDGNSPLEELQVTDITADGWFAIHGNDGAGKGYVWQYQLRTIGEVLEVF